MVFEHSIDPTSLDGQLPKIDKQGRFQEENDDDDDDVLSVMESFLKLFFFLIVEMIGVFSALVPLCQFAVMFLCFLANSTCDILETKCASRRMQKLLILIVQTAALISLTEFCTRCMFGAIFGLTCQAFDNLVYISKGLGMLA